MRRPRSGVSSIVCSAPALVLAIVVASVVGCASERAREAPPVAPSNAGRKDGSCAGCHSAIAAEWSKSLHRASHDDPSYQAALAGEPRAFCNDCHAPTANLSVGVTCSSCHVRPHADPTKALAASTRTCAECHEFRFPNGEGWMQTTAAEHRASAHASESCESCHMPWVQEHANGSKHRSHAFGASRDPVMLRRALHVDANVIAPGTVAITLRVAGAGHAVPTGDMFRRLLVVAEAVDERGAVVGRAQRRLARRFDTAPGGGYVEIADDRPGGRLGPSIRVPLDLGESAATARIRYRVEHERALNDFHAPDRILGSTTLAEGEIAQ